VDFRLDFGVDGPDVLEIPTLDRSNLLLLGALLSLAGGWVLRRRG
jgi:LPXTG-motif cell wall-anchored protein